MSETPDPTIHVVIEEAISAYEKRQREQRRFLRGNLPAWAALCFTIIAFFVGVGLLKAQISENTRNVDKNDIRISALESDRVEWKSSISDINAKLDILLEDRRGEAK